MSRLKLPVLGPTIPPAAGTGPVVVGGTVVESGVVTGDLATKDEPPAPYSIVEVGAEDLGLKPHVEAQQATQQVAQPTSAIPEGYRGETIMLPTKDVAKLDELARTMLEIRGEVAEVARRVGGVDADLASHKSNSSSAWSRLQAQCEVLRDRLDAGLKLPADVDRSIRDAAELVAECSRRLDAVDEALAAKGLPTSKAATTPTLHLRPTRVLAVKAKLDGTAVVLHYNPRQGRDGDDPQEITIREQPRPVMTGYAVDVPAGYVCDVFVGADVVASLQGRGEGELTVNMRSKGPYGRTIGGGHEICRLALRKMEPLCVEISAVL